jgi:hypothetical protein
MLTSKRDLIFAALGLGLMMTISVQPVQAQRNKKAAADTARTKPADTTKKPPVVPPPAIKPYKDVITTGMKTSNGFITVHQKDDKYYFEIPNEVLGRDILIVSRVSKASAEMRNGNSGYAGDQINETVYRFEKGPNKKLFMRRIYFKEYAGDSTQSMFASVQKNNVAAIAMAWPIAAYKPDSSATVVDVTEFLNSDNDVLYFQNKRMKDRAGMGAQQNDRSYLTSVRSFPKNVEVATVKTYTAGMNPTASNYTVELNASLLLLPAKPMQPRLMDERVGYFITGHRDFDADPQGVADKIYATRWRLEPKPEDVEKYKRGELVEPAKPIIFYIDPVTPKKWVPYLMQGVNDWQKAFEKAGFKNAIFAKEAPTKEEDSTWSIDDATHSAIVYRPSAIANAMGPSVADPRSGEILESHIFWYHNVMSLLNRWYMAQCGAVDPRALKNELSDSLMGTLIRFVSCHEVGHTLGLRHNFGSSSTVPVEKLRDKAWVELNGHTPSIMDYARFNYVAQPEDKISEKGLFPRINDYDNWAIQWGYTWRPEFRNATDEQKALTKVVSDSLAKNNRLWFGSETSYTDHRCQNEDLSDNVVKAGEYGIRNLKRLLPHIQKWSIVPHEDFSKPMDVYQTIINQFGLYLYHATNMVGSVMATPKVGAQSGPVWEPVSAAKQKEAIQFLNTQLFQTPMWLKNNELLDKTPSSFLKEISEMQTTTLSAIVSRMRLIRMLWMEQVYEGKNYKAYTISEMLLDLNKGIFAELYAGKNVDVYRRNMQKIYVNRLLAQAYSQISEGDLSTMLPAFGTNYYNSDIRSFIKDNLQQLLALIKKAQANPATDKLTRMHLQELELRIATKFAAEKRGEIVR